MPRLGECPPCNIKVRKSDSVVDCRVAANATPTASRVEEALRRLVRGASNRGLARSQLERADYTRESTKQLKCFSISEVRPSVEHKFSDDIVAANKILLRTDVHYRSRDSFSKANFSRVLQASD